MFLRYLIFVIQSANDSREKKIQGHLKNYLRTPSNYCLLSRVKKDCHSDNLNFWNMPYTHCWQIWRTFNWTYWKIFLRLIVKSSIIYFISLGIQGFSFAQFSSEFPMENFFERFHRRKIKRIWFSFFKSKLHRYSFLWDKIWERNGESSE